MTMIFSLTPGLIFLIGGCVSIFCKGVVKKGLVLLVPVIAFLQLLSLNSSSVFKVSFLTMELNWLQVDSLSMVFGYIFTISSFIAFLYGISISKKLEFTSGLIYIGSALSVIFAKDLITTYIFWELMALSSVLLIFLRATADAHKAAMRYLLVHIVGGLVLLSGIIIHIQSSGSINISSIEYGQIATWLMLIGVLVNAAVLPFSSWLPDAYPESTIMGGVLLSTYTSKTAIYLLLRGFVGIELLIWLGCLVAIYGSIYALLENDIRRILAYSVINQIGFKVCAVGIGTSLAIAGASAHVFCGIIYNSLLWMAAGSVMFSTGKTKLTELGGLYKKLPWTCIFMIIGALSISAFPLTSGFTSKTIILKAAKLDQLFWPWVALEVASVGAFLAVAMRMIYFLFFSRKNNQGKVKKINIFMMTGMGIAGSLCILLGVMPKYLYGILPYSYKVLSKIPATFSSIYIKKFYQVVLQWQLLGFAGLAFIIILPILKPKAGRLLEFDWVYRRLLRYITAFAISFIDFVYQTINNLAMFIVRSVSSFFQQSIPRVLFLLNLPYLRFSKVQVNQQDLLDNYTKAVKRQAIPFSVIGALVFVLFILIYFLV